MAETDFEDRRISRSRDLHLDLDLGSGHSKPSCITHRSLPTNRISFKSVKLVVTYGLGSVVVTVRALNL